MSGSNATSAPALSVSDITTLDGEPRVKDLRIAERLGFDRPRNIRKLIERNIDELEAYGKVRSTVERTSEKGGRPGSRAYHLNEGQTLLVCMLARTPQAAAVRKEVIDIYMAHRRSGDERTKQIEHRSADPLEGAGSVRINGELVYFDARLESVNENDGVVAMLPRPDTPTLQLAVVKGPLTWLPDRQKTFGDRSVYRCLGIMPGTRITHYEECIAIGRVISRRPINTDGGAA